MGSIFCARCGKEGHIAADCKVPGNPNKRQREDMMVVFDEFISARSSAAEAPLFLARPSAAEKEENIDKFFCSTKLKVRAMLY